MNFFLGLARTLSGCSSILTPDLPPLVVASLGPTLPSWPCSPVPTLYTPPSLSSSSTWSDPEATLITSLSWASGTGVRSILLEGLAGLRPKGPEESLKVPQYQALPASVRATVWESPAVICTTKGSPGMVTLAGV